MEQKLYVLLGDMISSRRITHRDAFLNKLEETYSTINSTYAPDIYADFKILKGIDEIGAVLTNKSNIFVIITTILEQIHPCTMRFVLVRDYIDTALITRDVAKMDGPAFHKASRIMSRLKQSKLMFDMLTGDEKMDAAIIGQINLILLLKKNWSVRQYQIVKEYEKKLNQSETAAKLGITQQAVSKTLNRLNWKEIKSIENKLQSLLESCQ